MYYCFYYLFLSIILFGLSFQSNESNLSRDITNSSISMSEGEGDVDLEGMAGRVAKLEELLQGKEEVVEALNAEFDELRNEASSPNSSLSHNSSIQYKDIITNYHSKVKCNLLSY